MVTFRPVQPRSDSVKSAHRDEMLLAGTFRRYLSAAVNLEWRE